MTVDNEMNNPVSKFLIDTWYGRRSLAFTFWIMGFIAPTPIFIGKVVLRDAGIFEHENLLIFFGGQLFLWIEWAYFAFLTIALWNSAKAHIAASEHNSGMNALWGKICLVLAVASGLLALGSLANLTGLTALLFGQDMFLFS